MAAIDKIYGTHEEWLKLKSWLTAHFPYGLSRMYPEPPMDGEEYHLSNFDVVTDMYLKDHCELEFVRHTLRQQGYEVPEKPKKPSLNKHAKHTK